jgi:pyruvate dehydrogenase E2 component (dihydrolipoamide acetyltransferase)
MAGEVRLPRLGQGMESGTIVKWLKAEGERVEKGEPLYEVDTEKATQEVEAEQSGVLLRIAVRSGEVPVGQTVGVIGAQGESLPDEPPQPPGRNGGADASAAEGSPAPAARPERISDPRALIVRGASEPPPDAERVKASPLARRIARERGIELRELSGSGPDGRILAEDVEGAAPGAVSAAPPGPPRRVEDGEGVESIPLTTIRRTIARRLTEAARVPAFQLTVSAEMTRARALVERARELNPGIRVTLTDLLAKLCASALVRHVELNTQFTDDALLRFSSANIGIAVAAPNGLVVPVIASVERLSLAEVATRRVELVERARAGRLTPDDLEGGTFTISNLGMYGVEQFVAVLNPPQAAILAVGATLEQVVVRAGEVVVAPVMAMTLTVDHRAVDGGPAAEFLRSLRTFLEDPALAL